MKVLLTITRWVMGVICCFVSIGGFASGDAVAAIALLVAGLLLLPPVSSLFFKKRLALAAPVTEAMAAPRTIAGSDSSAKASGIFAWFKGWRNAINTAVTVDSLIQSFPNTDPKKFQSFIALMNSLTNEEISVLRKRVTDGYDKKITVYNVETLGHAYLDFYKSIFPAMRTLPSGKK